MNRFVGEWEDLEFEDDVENKPEGEAEEDKQKNLRGRLRRK